MNVDDTVLAEIKAATRLAIHRLGGLVAAAMLTRAEKTALGEYQSINQPQRVVPVDIALQLDAALERPVILPVLARALGLSVAAPEGPALAGVDAAVATVAQEAGALAAELLLARADGVLSPGEQAGLARRAAQVAEGAGAVVAELGGGATRRAGPALKVAG